MWHVYKTAVSDVTSDYAGNTANQFKVKLGLKLPGKGWTVAVHSAIIPKMALFKDLQSEPHDLMQIWFDIKGTVQQGDRRKKGYVHANDVKALEKEHKCRTGVDFMNEVKSLMDERRHTLIPRGKSVLDAHWAKLEWKREASEPELVIQHSDPSTHILINKKFAQRMKWVNKTNNLDYRAGPNLVINYPSYIRDLSELSTKEATKVDANWLYLSAKPDFRLINLNAAFVDALNLHARPLSVTANVKVESTTIPHPLGQVYYAPQGRDRYVFTPPVEEWHPVHVLDWDEVEFTLKELDGTPVGFQPDSQCLLRLHFKQEE